MNQRFIQVPQRKYVTNFAKKYKFRIQSGFFLGYSPERINPGDKKHKLENIVKVTSGSNDEAAEFIDDLYNSVIDAGLSRHPLLKLLKRLRLLRTHNATLNIALINELSVIFRRIGIDTNEVLEASRTNGISLILDRVL